MTGSQDRYTRAMEGWESHKAQTVMASLLDADDVGVAVRVLALRADETQAEPFERYAGLALRDVGAADLESPGKPAVRLQRVADGQLVRLHAATTGSNDRTLRIVEDVINRLLGVCSAMENGIGAHKHERGISKATLQREIYEIQGLEYPLWSNPLRGSHVALPPVSLLLKSPQAYFNEVDWRMLDNVASIAHLCYQSTLLANSNQRIFGVKGPHSSEWDVRTRLASSLGNLWTSLHVPHRFDCDLGRSTATVHFTMPPLESFPARVSAPGASQPEPVGDRLSAARIVYCLRLAALIAATCFGAGRSVERAFVAGLDEQGRPLVSCTFDRRQFVYETLPAIDSGRAAHPDLRFDPAKAQATLAASRSDFDMRGAKPLPTGLLRATRTTPCEDGRILPDDMQWFFHAKRVRDVDVAGYAGGAANIIDEAREDSRGAQIAAVARLEELVDELESALSPPEDQPDARPLFCENALQRAAVFLLDDQLSIGADAEAFLSFEDDEPHPLPDVYYYRAPNALFHARMGLADLYRKLNDFHGAEEQADRMIALAPTVAAGYVVKADALACQDRRREAANVAMDGLRSAVTEPDCAMLQFNLALLFRHIGRWQESEALLVHASTLSGLYAGKALDVLGDVADGVPPQAFAIANLADSREIIRKHGIPLMTERMRNAIVARAALGLANAHAPNAAAPYIKLLAQHFPDNRAIQSACDSILRGLG